MDCYRALGQGSVFALILITSCFAIAQETPPPIEAEPGEARPEGTATEMVETEGVQRGAETVKKTLSDRIELRGDLRYRVEMIKKGSGDLRYRHRVRARPALEATVFDDLSATIGLGTGGPGGTTREGDPRSNNQTLTHGFSSKFLWLDLAYFDYHPSWFEGFTILGGKMKNPLYRVGKSELLWDPDLNPEGLAMAYKRQLGIVEPFVTGVSYLVEERSAADDSWLLGAQGGLKLHFRNLYALVGGRYMNYTKIKGRAPVYDATDSFGNSATTTVDSSGVETTTLDNDFNILGGFLEVGGILMGLPWAVFGDLAANTAVEDEKNAWLVGALVGSTKKQWGYKLRYIYRRIQADSVYGSFTDSDFFGGITGGKGHEVNFSLALHKLVSFGTTYFFNQGPMQESANEFDYHRVQIDLKMRF